MKIEKINDNQIRCTLTRTDLAERQLQLSELAYGTEKARSLFHDMMQQAAYEFGFEAEDIPLMIEAIPASSDSIVLTQMNLIPGFQNLLLLRPTIPDKRNMSPWISLKALKPC